MKTRSSLQITITTGLALFAMFFGAGNMIFPLKLGAVAGQYTLFALITFLISGVAVPFLGLYAVALYEGDYWKFFNRIGKVPAFLIITFLILILGPLFVTPRTEIVTYHTLLPVLPPVLSNVYVFDLFYFLIIASVALYPSRVVDFIGYLLSPVKLIAFATLIAVALSIAEPMTLTQLSVTSLFTNALTMGYGTMDLLAALFFCTVAYAHIVHKCKANGVTSQILIRKMTLRACILGALLISLVYTGFFYAASFHASALQGTPTEALIEKLSLAVLGQYGSLFVCVCVFFACLATGIALTEVSCNYFHKIIFCEKVPRPVCLLLVVTAMYFMAILGFDKIMQIAFPVLNVLYPLLILYCVVNTFLKLKGARLGRKVLKTV